MVRNKLFPHFLCSIQNKKVASLSPPQRFRERERETKRDIWREKSDKRGRAGDHGKDHLPSDPRALTILFPSPPINSVLSLALHPLDCLENPREPLRSAEERGLRGSLGYVLKFWAFLAVFKEKKVYPKKLSQCMFRDRGAILRWEGGGAPLVTQYWGGEHKTIFLTNLYNFGNIGGGGGTCPPSSPYSAVPDVQDNGASGGWGRGTWGLQVGLTLCCEISTFVSPQKHNSDHLPPLGRRTDPQLSICCIFIWRQQRFSSL